ncbi:MAG: hypothetical protein A2Y42_03135 [Omnitrophica WOR_2 bacterium GWB2_45_9]|nr:MAG: hypothetical protein A2Y42_03135 [Omnitrophica WOR_2 bacterium GWB2_45_9]
MHKPKLYLDTTIPSYVFNSHVPDKQTAARKLFEYIDKEKAEAYISTVVVRELSKTGEDYLKDRLFALIKNITVLEVTQECVELAGEYIQRGIIPKENIDDALHIACASVYEIDFLVSYNFEHIVRVKTIDNVSAINVLLGFKTPRIIIPEEVIDV